MVLREYDSGRGQSLNDAIYSVATFTSVTIVRTLVPDEVAHSFILLFIKSRWNVVAEKQNILRRYLLFDRVQVVSCTFIIYNEIIVYYQMVEVPLIWSMVCLTKNKKIHI